MGTSCQTGSPQSDLNCQVKYNQQHATHIWFRSDIRSDYEMSTYNQVLNWHQCTETGQSKSSVKNLLCWHKGNWRIFPPWNSLLRNAQLFKYLWFTLCPRNSKKLSGTFSAVNYKWMHTLFSSFDDTNISCDSMRYASLRFYWDMPETTSIYNSEKNNAMSCKSVTLCIIKNIKWKAVHFRNSNEDGKYHTTL